MIRRGDSVLVTHAALSYLNGTQIWSQEMNKLVGRIGIVTDLVVATGEPLCQVLYKNNNFTFPESCLVRCDPISTVAKLYGLGMAHCPIGVGDKVKIINDPRHGGYSPMSIVSAMERMYREKNRVFVVTGKSSTGQGLRLDDDWSWPYWSVARVEPYIAYYSTTEDRPTRSVAVSKRPVVNLRTDC